MYGMVGDYLFRKESALSEEDIGHTRIIGMVDAASHVGRDE